MGEYQYPCNIVRLENGPEAETKLNYPFESISNARTDSPVIDYHYLALPNARPDSPFFFRISGTGSRLKFRVKSDKNVNYSEILLNNWNIFCIN